VNEPKPSTSWCGRPGRWRSRKELFQLPIRVQIDVDLFSIFPYRKLPTVIQVQKRVWDVRTVIIEVYVILANVVKRNPLDLHQIVNIHTR
jgi:hypothetical protein